MQWIGPSDGKGSMTESHCIAREICPTLCDKEELITGETDFRKQAKTTPIILDNDTPIMKDTNHEMPVAQLTSHHQELATLM
jgi:hypothetical protein